MLLRLSGSTLNPPGGALRLIGAEVGGVVAVVEVGGET